MDLLRKTIKILNIKGIKYSIGRASQTNYRTMCQSANILGAQNLTSTKVEIAPENRNIQAGQPTPESHPHLLKYNEITGGITRQEYADRRSSLMSRLCELEDKQHIVIFPSTPRRYMIDKIPYLYRQDTDMLYMSGCQEADCVLLMHTLPGKENSFKSLMFTPQFDPGQTLWDGPRTMAGVSTEVWGVDDGLPIMELTRYLASIEIDLNSPCIWYHYMQPNNPEIHKMLHPWMSRIRTRKIDSIKPHIHNLRLIKSPAEINLMKTTCKISSDSILSTIKSCKSPTSEHELFATVDYHCRMNGADHLAYPPVVAGGSRANIIHYIKNNQVINPGELVLMDAGSEYRGYSGDVTRTWPINGEFSSAQRDVYEAVLEVQQTVIQSCAQHPTLDQLFSLMCLKLGKVLQELCILPNNYSDGQLMRASYGFCPHHVSHYLGMDVHDTPRILSNLPIRSNSIITVEPGIYISTKNKSVPSRYCGIGIRIEDDILITNNGYEILTNSCPKHPNEIEKLVGSDYKS